MSHFKPKSLAFYAMAISSVFILFKVVSEHGEAKLKAPLEPQSFEKRNPYTQEENVTPPAQQ